VIAETAVIASVALSGTAATAATAAGPQWAPNLVAAGAVALLAAVFALTRRRLGEAALAFAVHAAAVAGVLAALALAAWNERDVVAWGWRMGLRQLSRYSAQVRKLSGSAS